MVLEPILESHAPELLALFADRELHRFVPYEPLTLERQTERCRRWARRISPKGDELWLNWAGRSLASGRVIAHFQAGVRDAGAGSIGYLVARDHQKMGYATEGMSVVIRFLRDQFSVREVKAWIDSRNEASIALVKKLGMVEVAFKEDADFFKGEKSDEYVFGMVL